MSMCVSVYGTLGVETCVRVLQYGVEGSTESQLPIYITSAFFSLQGMKRESAQIVPHFSLKIKRVYKEGLS